MTDQTEAETRYFKLVDRLEEVEKEMTHLVPFCTLYLTDYCIDKENTEEGGLTEADGDEYWENMYCQAASAAGYRAEGYGFSINDFFPRPIF